MLSLRCNHVIRAIIGQPQPNLTLQTPSKPTQSLGIPANTMSKQLPHAIPPGQLAPTKSTIPPKPTKTWPFMLVSTALDVISKPAASNMQHSPDEMIRRRVQCSAPMRVTTGQAYRTLQGRVICDRYRHRKGPGAKPVTILTGRMHLRVSGLHTTEYLPSMCPHDR